MFKTTLVSQLFNSIDKHLNIINLSMDDIENDDELSISDHRSIFSSYGSRHLQKNLSSQLDNNSQYEGFYWDLYENHNYHHLTFEHEHEQQKTSLSDWSMDLDDSPRHTSWSQIKTKSTSSSSSVTTTPDTSSSDSYSPYPLTLYSLYQRRKFQQHPCRLYDNFSDNSQCDSLTSSSSSSSSSHSNSIKHKSKIRTSKIKVKSPTKCSDIKLNSKSKCDQCLQTSIISNHSLDNSNPSSSSSTRHSLPNLDFLTYYANENPLRQLSIPTKHICTSMKRPLFEPLTLANKSIRTVFYCAVQLPSNHPITFHPTLQKPRTLKEIKRTKTIKTSPTTISAEDNETFSSVCSSSTSSSGYFSNSSRHIQTPLSSYPLKSCLKRTKTDDLSKEILTSTTQPNHLNQETPKHRRYSAPTTSSPSHAHNSSYSTKPKLYTLSEHDLRTKKSVSFCHEIARRLITPSTSPKSRDDYCDLLPREYLTDSPPNEFHLSDGDNDNQEEDEELINFTENVPEDLTKPLPIKYDNDKNLIDAFSNTILHILEIKCNDPNSYYLNNLTNAELDRILRHDLCMLIREILEDGLRQNTNSLFSRKIHLWRLIDLTIPRTNRFNEAKIKSQVGLSSTLDSNEKFNSFIYQLLNLHQLAAWFTYFLSQRTFLNSYYESWAFILVNNQNNLFENLTNQLEKLSPLAFRLKYTYSRTNLSILPKKFHVRTWLRDRKNQMKISTKDSQNPPNVIIRRKFSAVPISKRQ